MNIRQHQAALRCATSRAAIKVGNVRDDATRVDCRRWDAKVIKWAGRAGWLVGHALVLGAGIATGIAVGKWLAHG